MGKVSVIIPVFNRMSELMIPVTSVLEQDSSDWELILIDDGSTDGSARLCDELAQKYKKVKTFHQANSGVSIARNKGIEHASGQYLLFLDSDDWIEQDTIRKIVERMESDQSDMVAFAMQIDRFHGQECHSTALLFGEDICLDQVGLAENFTNLYYKDYLCSSCTKLFKKEIVDLYGIHFRPDLVMYEDFYFVMDYLAKASKVSIENHAYYHYRMDETIVLIKKRQTNDLLKNLDIVAERIEEFSRSLGIAQTKKIQKIIFEFYIMYLYKLFVTEYTFKERMKEIRRLFGYTRFINSEFASSGEDAGKFYAALRWAIRRKNALIVYVLYRNKYKQVGIHG